MDAKGDGQDKMTAQMLRRLQIVELLDCYGSLLKQKQSDLLDLYYNQDLSLAELAEEQGVSRQAIHEAIKRGESALYDFEARLGFLGKLQAWQRMTEEVAEWPIQDERVETLRRMWLKRAETLL